MSIRELLRMDWGDQPPRGHPLPVLWLRNHIDPRLFPRGLSDDEMFRYALRAYTVRSGREFQRRAHELRLPLWTRARIYWHRLRLIGSALNGDLPDEVWDRRGNSEEKSE